LLLILASAVVFKSESHGIRDHIFLSQIRNVLFVSYDSQGYDEGIRTRLHRIAYLEMIAYFDHICGLVVRNSGYRFRGPGFDSRPYWIF
jgi:hypothetical protein